MLRAVSKQGLWYRCITVLSELSSIMDHLLFICSNVHCFAEDANTSTSAVSALLHWFKWMLISVWYSCSKQDTVPLETQMVVYCNCQMCKFCEGGKERQQFSSATSSEKLWKSSVLWQHWRFALLVTRLGVIYCCCLLHTVVGLFPMMKTWFSFP